MRRVVVGLAEGRNGIYGSSQEDTGKGEEEDGWEGLEEQIGRAWTGQAEEETESAETSEEGCKQARAQSQNVAEAS